MNRTLPLIPSRHAALLPAPPPSRHVVGVKAWGVKRERETGAEIRDHPPSPPVSNTVSVVAVAWGTAYLRSGAGIVTMAAQRAVKPGGCFVKLKRPFLLPPSSRCVGLPLQTALGPLLASASRGACAAAGSADRWRAPALLLITT